MGVSVRQALQLLLAALPTAAAAQYASPDSARIETADVDRFLEAARALRAAPTLRDSARVLFERYYYPGSDGLLDFIERRIGSAFQLAAKIRERPAYYAHLPTSLGGLGVIAPRIRAAFERFEAMWPDAIFADVYFVIGRMNSGGTTSQDKLLIGAEMYGRDSAAPTGELSGWEGRVLRDTSMVVAIVVHELMHVNQAPLSGVTATVLAQAIREGGADFVAELVTGRNINDHVHAWANPRERELWQEFRAAMDGRDFGRWFGDSGEAGRPPDLGYYVGYRIAKALYDRSPDKRRAIGEILRGADAPGLLAASGYSP
jgi:hypothetical protein